MKYEGVYVYDVCSIFTVLITERKSILDCALHQVDYSYCHSIYIVEHTSIF